jgi:hypothetical protein
MLTLYKEMQMEIYNVGTDQLSEYDFGCVKEGFFEWFVYWYEIGYYDGQGEGVALGKDGLLYYGSLGHCSCYGPMDSWTEPEKFTQKFTVDEFFSQRTIFDNMAEKPTVEQKVRELLGR